MMLDVARLERDYAFRNNTISGAARVGRLTSSSKPRHIRSSVPVRYPLLNDLKLSGSRGLTAVANRARIVLPLAGILLFFGHLPAVCSRIFVAILNFSTPLFNRINAMGPRTGACLLGRAGLISKFDQVHGTILGRLERVRPSDWALAMHYPSRWDPRFKTPMHMEDLFRYPVDHLRHHRHQLRTTQ